MIVIATASGGNVHILLETKSKNEFKIFVTDVIGCDRIAYLGNNFSDFLDVFITTYGYPFWEEWIKDSSKGIFKLN